MALLRAGSPNHACRCMPRRPGLAHHAPFPLCRGCRGGPGGARVRPPQVGHARPLVKRAQIRGLQPALLLRCAPVRPPLAARQETGPAVGVPGRRALQPAQLACPAVQPALSRGNCALPVDTRQRCRLGVLPGLPPGHTLASPALLSVGPPQPTQGSATWQEWTTRCCAASGAATAPAGWAAATAPPMQRTPG